MGWSFGPVSWQPDELAAVKDFAAAHATQHYGPLDDAWWAAAGDAHAVEPRGAAGNYATGEPLAQILVDLAGRWLWMNEWRAAGRRMPMRLVVVPFGFWLDDLSPPAATTLLADGAELVIVDPLRLLDHWPGMDDEAYGQRSAIAWEQVRTLAPSVLRPETDEDWETLVVGLERWLWEIGQACWKARVPWTIAW